MLSNDYFKKLSDISSVIVHRILYVNSFVKGFIPLPWERPSSFIIGSDHFSLILENRNQLAGGIVITTLRFNISAHPSGNWGWLPSNRFPPRHQSKNYKDSKNSKHINDLFLINLSLIASSNQLLLKVNILNTFSWEENPLCSKWRLELYSKWERLNRGITFP